MTKTSYFTRHSGNRSWLIVLSLMLLFVLAGFVYALQQHVGHAAPKHTDVARNLTSDQYTERITHPDVVTKLVIGDNKKVTSGPTRIVVKLGQSVNVNIYATGEEATVHLNGYNINTEAGIEEGAEGGFHFVADTTGSFPFYAMSDEDGQQAVTPRQLGTIVVE